MNGISKLGDNHASRKRDEINSGALLQLTSSTIHKQKPKLGVSHGGRYSYNAMEMKPGTGKWCILFVIVASFQ